MFLDILFYWFVISVSIILLDLLFDRKSFNEFMECVSFIPHPIFAIMFCILAIIFTPVMIIIYRAKQLGYYTSDKYYDIKYWFTNLFIDISNLVYNYTFKKRILDELQKQWWATADEDREDVLWKRIEKVEKISIIGIFIKSRFVHLNDKHNDNNN